MNFLVTSGRIPAAQKVVIYGVEGIGKSTFASQFPNPVFIDTEDSTTYMENVNRLPKPTSWEMLFQEVDFIKFQTYKTLVIDTMDWAEDLCKKHLMAQNKWSDSGNDYGNKYIALEKEMGNLLNKLTEVKDAGINVVVTAHAMLRKKEEPDEMGAFDRYELKLEKKTAAKVKEWADMVLFANYKTIVITDNKTNSKKATGGQRMMFTTHRPAWDAKNRIGLPDEMDFNYSAFDPFFAQATEGVNQPVQNVEPVQPSTLLPPQEEPNFQREPIVPHAVIPQAVSDLMVHDGVSTDEIMGVIYVGGFMPENTPIENVPPELWGYLQTSWDKAMNLLNTRIRQF